jgi:predicted kinase
MIDEPGVILITGTMAVGKSSVAQALAERLSKSVHLRGDVFRRMIVSGRAEMTVQLSAEAERRLWLRYRLAAAAADRYVEAGFTVVYQDILIGPALAAVAALYRPHPLAVIVLCPWPEVVAARDAKRAKTGYADQADVYAFDRVLRSETPRMDYWLDNSDPTITETVDRILEHLPQAWCKPRAFCERMRGAAGSGTRNGQATLTCCPPICHQERSV